MKYAAGKAGFYEGKWLKKTRDWIQASVQIFLHSVGKYSWILNLAQNEFLNKKIEISSLSNECKSHNFTAIAHLY